MSMIAHALRVSSQELSVYLNDSSLLEQRLSSILLSDHEKPDLLDLDKTWESIYYMLTGDSIEGIESNNSPFNGILFTNKVIDENVDMGYGPATYLEPEEVYALHLLLEKINQDEFQQKYDAEQMNEANVYPEGWQNDRGEVEYIVEHFIKLKSFYATAVKEKQAVINFMV